MEKSNVTPLVPKDKNSKDNETLVSSLSPREIVSELDRFVVGQNKAKKAVAVALRNRWRRQALKVASDICVFTNNNVTMEKI